MSCNPTLISKHSNRCQAVGELMLLGCHPHRLATTGGFQLLNRNGGQPA